MAAQDGSNSRASAATGIVLQVADKKHTITGAQLAKYPDSLLFRLATADLDGSSSSVSSNAKVLQLDSMGSTPLAYWPESAAPIICSIYSSVSGAASSTLSMLIPAAEVYCHLYVCACCMFLQALKPQCMPSEHPG
jgi:hypothetical protein